MALGYSHPVSIEPPEGIEFEVPQPTEVVVRGIDKQLVGQVAADIRKRRPPEPYKGKGIRYRDEHVAAQGREEGLEMTVLTKRQARLRRRRRVRARIVGSAERPRLSVYRSNRGIFAQLIDDGAGRTLAAVNWIEPELRKLSAADAGEAGRRAAGRARQGGRRRDLRLRSRRLPVPRPRQGARRRRPRGGTEVLMAARPLPSPARMKGMDMTNVETVSPRGLDLQERVIEINRVAKVVKGGRRFSFTALVAVGDEEGVVGIGYGKAREVPLAIQKAVENARKNLIRVPKYGQTLTHKIIGRYGAGHVVLRPASPGTGVIAGGGVRAVLELGGVRDVLTKSIGTQNPINLVKATMDGLVRLRRPEEVAELRGLTVAQVLGVAKTNGGTAAGSEHLAAGPVAGQEPAADDRGPGRRARGSCRGGGHLPPRKRAGEERHRHASRGRGV